MDCVILQVGLVSFGTSFSSILIIGAQLEATFSSLQIALIGTKPNYYLIFLFKVMFDPLSESGSQRGSYLTNVLSTRFKNKRF